MRWEIYVEYVRQMRNVYKFWSENLTYSDRLGTARCRQKVQ